MTLKLFRLLNCNKFTSPRSFRACPRSCSCAPGGSREGRRQGNGAHRAYWRRGEESWGRWHWAQGAAQLRRPSEKFGPVNSSLFSINPEFWLSFQKNSLFKNCLGPPKKQVALKNCWHPRAHQPGFVIFFWPKGPLGPSQMLCQHPVCPGL